MMIRLYNQTPCVAASRKTFSSQIRTWQAPKDESIPQSLLLWSPVSGSWLSRRWKLSSNLDVCANLGDVESAVLVPNRRVNVLADIDWDVAEHRGKGGGGAMLGHQRRLETVDMANKHMAYWWEGGGGATFGCQRRLKTVSIDIGTIHLCHVGGGKREATNSDALFPGTKLLQTFTLVRYWVPAASPYSFVVCWLSFPESILSNQKTKSHLHRVLFQGSALLLTSSISFVEKFNNVR